MGLAVPKSFLLSSRGIGLGTVGRELASDGINTQGKSSDERLAEYLGLAQDELLVACLGCWPVCSGSLRTVSYHLSGDWVHARLRCINSRKLRKLEKLS
jgi:hypothetical protein